MNSLLTMMKEKEISARAYNLTIGAMLFYGFFINMIMCMYFTDVFMGWNPIALIVGYLISCFVGILMAKTHNPIMSFTGYNLVVLPIGVVLSISLDSVYSGVILNAFIVTTVLTVFLIVTATIYPEFFKKLGGVLLVSLFIVLIVELIMMFSGMYVPALIDWLVCVLFCGYIGYDWAVAQSLPHTYDNAIDSALNLYLDIINLFVRLIEIAQKNRD